MRVERKKSKRGLVHVHSPILYLNQFSSCGTLVFCDIGGYHCGNKVMIGEVTGFAVKKDKAEGVKAVTNQTFYVKFFAPVVPESVAALMQVVDSKMKQGAKRLGLLISSPGGDVFHGLSVYNYLKGCPLQITTHNFGSADSIGVVIFCCGSRRLSVPHARFLLHGVQANFNQPVSLEEKQLEERLKGLQIDMGNIARVIADTVRKDKESVIKDMLERTTLYPEQAIEYGLVHEIKSELFEAGAEVISIQMSPQPPGPQKASTQMNALGAPIVEVSQARQ
jgi:ATP-dependent Clp protease, protease subunit